MAYELRPGDECVVANDFSVGGKQAFKRGDIARIVEISADRLQPGNKYVVDSPLLGEQVRLPGVVLKRISCPDCGSRLEETASGEYSDVCECGWSDVERRRLKRVEKSADETLARVQDRLSQMGPADRYDPSTGEDHPGPVLGDGHPSASSALMESALKWRNEKMGLPTQDVGDMCPLCDAAALAGKQRCPACGRNLAGVQFADGKSAAAGEFFCPKCHEQLSDDPLECPFCGWRFQSKDDRPRRRLATVKRDIVIEGLAAFREGEMVAVEQESPDPQRPEYRFVVLSEALEKRFRLTDEDLAF
jgi:hypothetical protein